MGHYFETYSFIECLKPGEVLLSKTTESCLNKSDLFNDFLVVSYQSGRYKDAFYFVPEKMAKDAEIALNLYSQTKPGFYAYLISIKDDGKFLELALKTTAGCAEKGGDWRDGTALTDIPNVYSGNYLMLDKNLVTYARAAPSQDNDTKNSSWSCGPNSGYRALRCFGEMGHDYDSFIDDCPRTISRDDMINVGGGLAVGGGAILGILGAIFAPISGGLSLLPAAAVWAAGGATAVTGAAISSDVGPGPRELASYLNSKMRGRAEFSGYSSQENYERDIRRDISNGYPRIVLLISGTVSMHYVVIVGVKPMGDFIKEAIILNTNGTLRVISDEKLRHWMDRDGYANGLLPAKYNTIEFFRS